MTRLTGKIPLTWLRIMRNSQWQQTLFQCECLVSVVTCTYSTWSASMSLDVTASSRPSSSTSIVLIGRCYQLQLSKFHFSPRLYQLCETLLEAIKCVHTYPSHALLSCWCLLTCWFHRIFLSFSFCSISLYRATAVLQQPNAPSVFHGNHICCHLVEGNVGATSS